jgi:hypothetical protein
MLRSFSLDRPSSLFHSLPLTPHRRHLESGLKEAVMMLELLRRFKFGIAAVAFVFAPAAWYVTPAFDARPACQRGGDWIARHAAQLPQTLDEFAAFPSGMRRVVFSAIVCGCEGGNVAGTIAAICPLTDLIYRAAAISEPSRETLHS